VRGLSPQALRRANERLRSDGDADVSLAALASDAGLSRVHFCRAFKTPAFHRITDCVGTGSSWP
jgi:AraC family transcriptional regulator